MWIPEEHGDTWLLNLLLCLNESVINAVVTIDGGYRMYSAVDNLHTKNSMDAWTEPDVPLDGSKVN
jgi:hypothetical protein